MSIQDKLEHVLKDIHVFFSKSDVYMNSPDKIIINKREMFELLEKLNLCVYEMMDEYEVTTQSRELALRRSEKKGEAIIETATERAEDVYAASFVYTDDALGHIYNIVTEATESIQKIVETVSVNLDREKVQIKTNQFELREQLQDFKDSNKYLLLIDELNRKRDKEFEKEKNGEGTKKKIKNDVKPFSAPKPEIKINKEYFEKMGLDENFDSNECETEEVKEVKEIEEIKEEKEVEEIDKPENAKEVEVKVDLDAEYFKWKEDEEDSDEDKPKEKRKFLFWKQ